MHHTKKTNKSLKWTGEIYAYHATSGKFKEEASNSGSKQLCNNVENPTKQSDVSTNESTEGNGGINMAAGDVSTDGDGHKQPEGMRYRGRDEAGGSSGTVS